MNKDQFIKELGESLSSFVGKRNIKTTKEQISLKTQEMIQRMDAQLHGGSVTQVATMWENMSIKLKTIWFICNKLIPYIGKEARRLYSNTHSSYYEVADRDNDDYFEVKIPKIFESDPKMIIETDIVIKPIQSVEFIGITATIEKDGVTFDG